MKNKWQVIVSVRRLCVKRPNKELGAKAPSTSTGPVKEFFLAPMGGLPDLGKGLDYTVLGGMVRLLVEIGTLLSNIVRNLRK